MQALSNAREAPKVSASNKRALPPPVEANIVSQPLQPFCEIPADIVLQVVNVGGCCELISGCSVALALEFAVIHYNGFCIPRHFASKHIPDAVLVLLLGTAVVDDNIAKHFEAFAL